MANTFKYEPTLYDKETPLLTAGEKKNAYNFALEPDEEDILYIWDEDENSLNGISMMIPSIYRTMKTMDLVSGSMGNPYIFPINLSLHSPIPISLWMMGERSA